MNFSFFKKLFKAKKETSITTTSTTNNIDVNTIKKEIGEIKQGLILIDEIYDDFYQRYSLNEEIKNELLNNIAADQVNGVSSQEILKKYVYH